jgi:hypothetical protein
VRGEVAGFDDSQRVGWMKEAKTHGAYRPEGKRSVVQDGDLMHILNGKEMVGKRQEPRPALAPYPSRTNFCNE